MRHCSDLITARSQRARRDSEEEALGLLQSPSATSRTSRHSLGGLAGLVGACLIIAWFWAIVLPGIGGDRSLRNAIDRRDALGINAEAMFYTELEAMESLVVRWNSAEK